MQAHPCGACMAILLVIRHIHYHALEFAVLTLPLHYHQMLDRTRKNGMHLKGTKEWDSLQLALRPTTCCYLAAHSPSFLRASLSKFHETSFQSPAAPGKHVESSYGYTPPFQARRPLASQEDLARQDLQLSCRLARGCLLHLHMTGRCHAIAPPRAALPPMAAGKAAEPAVPEICGFQPSCCGFGPLAIQQVVSFMVQWPFPFHSTASAPVLNGRVH